MISSSTGNMPLLSELLVLNCWQAILTANPPFLKSFLLHMPKPSNKNFFTETLINRPLYCPNIKGSALFSVGTTSGDSASAVCIRLCKNYGSELY